VKIVIDAYAWIEIFIGSKKGHKAREDLTQAEAIYTPDTVMAEIARKYFREGVEEQTVLKRLKTIEETSDVVPVEKSVALESAKCYMKLSEKARNENLKSPSLFDAIVLATARLLNAKVLTGDAHFRELPQTLWIG